LALLTVDDEKFWINCKPLELSDSVPNLEDNVTVVGYPTGGSNISITKGIVSRIDMRVYTHSKRKLLTIQVDAAINRGNSGGPAMNGKLVVGVAFQGSKSIHANNIGYLIPIPVLKYFLNDVKKNGQTTGIPTVNMVCSSLTNENLRQYFQMTDGDDGKYN
jgi:S1-C subfamily serine protease